MRLLPQAKVPLKKRILPRNLPMSGAFSPSSSPWCTNEQTPDRSLASLVGDLVKGKRQQGQGARSTTMQGQGLFSALDAPLQGLTPDDIEYAGDVDAALSRRPKVGARFISTVTIVFFAILLVWAGFSKIDEVTAAIIERYC